MAIFAKFLVVAAKMLITFMAMIHEMVMFMLLWREQRQQSGVMLWADPLKMPTTDSSWWMWEEADSGLTHRPSICVT